jgi:predicted nucleic acid-binding protein
MTRDLLVGERRDRLEASHYRRLQILLIAARVLRHGLEVLHDDRNDHVLAKCRR